MAFLKGIQPIIPVSDLEKSAIFFKNVLGFEIDSSASGFVRVKRDMAVITLVIAGDNVGQMSCYITVENIEEYHDELEANLKQLPEGRYRPLFSQPYGMKEFHVIDLDNLLIFFGEKIAK